MSATLNAMASSLAFTTGPELGGLDSIAAARAHLLRVGYRGIVHMSDEGLTHLLEQAALIRDLDRQIALTLKDHRK